MRGFPSKRKEARGNRKVENVRKGESNRRSSSFENIRGNTVRSWSCFCRKISDERQYSFLRAEKGIRVLRGRREGRDGAERRGRTVKTWGEKWIETFSLVTIRFSLVTIFLTQSLGIQSCLMILTLLGQLLDLVFYLLLTHASLPSCSPDLLFLPGFLVP